MIATDYTQDQEYRALLRRICETPADDAPRLILADVIQELGDDKLADFIRSMIAVWNDDGQGTLTHKQHEHHDEAIQSWLTNRHWGPELEKLFGWNWSRENCATWYQFDLRRESRAVWTRGFISEIRLTCAEFCGHQCERCNGSGTLYAHSFHPPCRLCSGTGRIDGVARALFSAHPITRVVLTDKKPLIVNAMESHNSVSFVWFSGPVLSRTSPNHLPDPMSYHCRAFYKSESAALDALSDACVSYGRSLAGLPALEAVSFQ